jgi:HEXXH motif-containing protein
MVIDWSRVAEPQPDQYDTGVTLARLQELRGPEAIPPRDGPTLFDGAVVVRPAEGPYLRVEGMSAAPVDDERILAGERYVRHWPAAFQQFKALMHTFYPLRDLAGTRIRPGSKGSISHSFGSQIGTMCATIEDPVSLAQAFVHEMAHNKLRALGIMVESAHDLITNNPQTLYPSPILIGTMRPMTACFHAEYSFIYVTQLNLKILADDPEEELRRYVLKLLERNVTRMEAGLAVIEENIQVDANGRLFVDGFLDWTRRVLSEGRTNLSDERT